MSDWSVLLLVSPFIVLILMAGVVMLVALCRASPADIPTVMSVSCEILCRLADRLPYDRHRHRLLDNETGNSDPDLVKEQ